MKWIFNRTRHPSFWLGTPCVPGGRARIMVMDDFGNAVDVQMKQWAHSAANGDH